MRGRPPNTDRRRAEILRAFARVMARQGYEGATVAEIAREAGLAPGLVHYHFENKAEILHLLVETLGMTARARIDAGLAQRVAPHDRLDAFIDGLLARGAGEDPDAAACWALIGAQAVTNAEVRGLYAQFVSELADRLSVLLIAACHEEKLSGEGSTAMAGALVATIEGYFGLAAAVPQAIAAGTAASMTKRMARGLIRAQPAKEHP